MSSFARYIGIDYSGASAPTQSLPGLRAYVANGENLPVEEPPPPSPRRYWTRRGLAEWLNLVLSDRIPTIVGIDHAFSFPRQYFDRYGIEKSWDTFLDDFCAHWPTDEDHVFVDLVRDGFAGHGAARVGDSLWRRMTEVRAGGAKSVFHFDVRGSVAKSTHAGIPWLRYLRSLYCDTVHFWPFDGWTIPSGKHTIVEVYPSLWKDLYPAENRNEHQHDAYTVCRRLRDLDQSSELVSALNPELTPTERAIAAYEGWILGVGSVDGQNRTRNSELETGNRE